MPGIEVYFDFIISIYWNKIFTEERNVILVCYSLYVKKVHALCKAICVPRMYFLFRPSPLFSRLASNAFPDVGSVGSIEKKKKNTRSFRNRRPGTSAPLLSSLETTRYEPKINMAEQEVGVIVKLRQRGKKDQPPKLLCDKRMV